MDSAQAQRRLQAINGHLISDVAESESILHPNSTAAEFVSGPLPLSLSRSYLSALVVYVVWKLNFDFVNERDRDRVLSGGRGFW